METTNGQRSNYLLKYDDYDILSVHAHGWPVLCWHCTEVIRITGNRNFRSHVLSLPGAKVP